MAPQNHATGAAITCVTGPGSEGVMEKVGYRAIPSSNNENNSIEFFRVKILFFEKAKRRVSR